MTIDFRKTLWRIAMAALFVVTATQSAFALGCFPIAGTSPQFAFHQTQHSSNFWGPRAVPSSIVQASFIPVAIPEDATVQFRYYGHSTYEIESREGVRAITDYNGYYGSEVPPTIATMNNAHSSHYTDYPDPAIEHVLRGWSEVGGLAEHDVLVKDMRVRNIPTSVHGRTGAQGNSNSIFIFEVEDLCIAHTGHLHHILTNTHLAEAGIIDVLMVPIDGVWTMSQENMAEVIDQLRPAIVMPMHYFSQSVLARFLALMEDKGWNIAVSEAPTAAFSRLTLPQRTVLVLPIS